MPFVSSELASSKSCAVRSKELCKRLSQVVIDQKGLETGEDTDHRDWRV